MQLIGSRVVSGEVTTTTNKSAAQVPFARKAAKLKAAQRALRVARSKAAKKRAAKNGKLHKHKLHPVDLADVRNRLANRVGLLDKREVLAVVGCTYPALWKWQQKKQFPLAKVVLGKSKWPAAIIADWLDALPVRPVKSADAPSDQKIEEPA
jgi:predicted DNA-binding transcriptional regulator AlpA